MNEEALNPNEELGTFSGPDGEELALVVSRTGRSVAVRHSGSEGSRTSVARIWHPLSVEPVVEIEDRWRTRSSSWKDSLRTLSIRALREAVPQSESRGLAAVTLLPSSLLDTFSGPDGRNLVCMMVARTGRSVTARLGDAKGQVIARAHRPTCIDPGIEFVGLYRHNTAEWKLEFTSLFAAALERAIATVSSTQAQAPVSVGRGSVGDGVGLPRGAVSP
ncbi:hypothetical protein [Glycomyces sp. MUSA5-2]|uniref:hypothetical protein n=1 Tax=Glycomyces sp. MUSA5-2 TaxID=2053002 RepID=UPI0030093FC9